MNLQSIIRKNLVCTTLPSTQNGNNVIDLSIGHEIDPFCTYAKLYKQVCANDDCKFTL